MHQRRTVVALGLWSWSLGAIASAMPAVAEPVHRLAMGWRVPEKLGETPDRMGIVEIDWAREQVRILSDLPAPDRVHGLRAMPDGGFVAVATRPGHWLVRCDAAGRVVARVTRAEEWPARTFNGHVECSADGQWLFTTETDSPLRTSWISVRDARNLHRVSQLSSAGFDAHQCLLGDDGHLMVANGGLLRADDGRKIALDRMKPSLARIDAENEEVIGQWRLPDERLSIRHLAWGRGADGQRLLGIGLQAEHDDAQQRRDAPVLALWRGGEMSLPSADAQAAGYVGDIAAGPAGGFVLSGEKAARGLWWHARAPRALTRVAELTDVCALAAVGADAGTAVLMASARGVARWHATQKPRMLPWPQAMRPDNHWVVLGRPS